MCKNFFIKYRYIILGFIFWVTCITLLCGLFTSFVQYCDRSNQFQRMEYIDHNIILRDSLIHEVNIYINDKFPKSELSADSLVMICLKYDFDIIFALSQAQLESGFGTVGVAKKTYSVWNVFSYDGMSADAIIKKGRHYNHPDESIEPYIILIKTKYLGTEKTYEDLLNNYISLSGYRYASNKNYEKLLRLIYNKIDKQTNIKDLHNKLNTEKGSI